MAARALILPSFRGAKPEDLPDLLERLREEIRAELASLRAQATGAWTVNPLVLSSAGSVTDMAWQTGYLCDTTGATVSVRLPYGRTENIGQRVAVIKTSAANNVTVYAAGGQYVIGAASVSPSAEGVREFVWCGEGITRGWRLVA